MKTFSPAEVAWVDAPWIWNKWAEEVGASGRHACCSAEDWALGHGRDNGVVEPKPSFSEWRNWTSRQGHSRAKVTYPVRGRASPFSTQGFFYYPWKTPCMSISCLLTPVIYYFSLWPWLGSFDPVKGIFKRHPTQLLEHSWNLTGSFVLQERVLPTSLRPPSQFNNNNFKIIVKKSGITSGKRRGRGEWDKLGD